jgi:pimeloyl-ACP methyl ester carboxylesterase
VEKESRMRTEYAVAPATRAETEIGDHPFSGRSIEIDGRPIHYVDEGGGSPLLFVQAGTGSSLWGDVIVRLRDGFRCVALDVLRIGSPRVPEGGLHDLGDLSRILGSFVEALDLHDLTLVLHDLGGPVGLGIAPRLHNRIRALIVAESFGWPLAQDTPQLVRMREYDLRVVDGTLRTVLKNRPLLLVFGEHSPAVEAGFPERWRERFPDAGLLLVEGSHRFPMADAPDLVARAIKGWWREEVCAA